MYAVNHIFYRNPFGQLLIQEIQASNMGIELSSLTYSEQIQARRQRYAVEYINQLPLNYMKYVQENAWKGNYRKLEENFAEFWTSQMLGKWVVCKRHNNHWESRKVYLRRVKGINYEWMHKKFAEIFQEGMEVELPVSRYGTPQYTLVFDGYGCMTEKGILHSIIKAAAIVDLTQTLCKEDCH